MRERVAGLEHGLAARPGLDEQVAPVEADLARAEQSLRVDAGRKARGSWTLRRESGRLFREQPYFGTIVWVR